MGGGGISAAAECRELDWKSADSGGSNGEVSRKEINVEIHKAKTGVWNGGRRYLGFSGTLESLGGDRGAGERCVV